jgi:cell division protein FtsX
MLVGALIATGVVLILTRDEREYVVVTQLTRDVTAEQKESVRSALGALEPVGDIEYRSSEQAWQEFQEIFEDMPTIVDQGSADAMPESFTLTTEDPEFDCSRLEPIRKLPGVDDFQVVQRANDEVLPAVVSCY